MNEMREAFRVIWEKHFYDRVSNDVSDYNFFIDICEWQRNKDAEICEKEADNAEDWEWDQVPGCFHCAEVIRNQEK